MNFMRYSNILRIILFALLLQAAYLQFCDSTCLTCTSPSPTDCTGCDQDLASNGAGSCIGLSSALGNSSTTQILQTINMNTLAPGYITSIGDLNYAGSLDVTAYLVLSGSLNGLITLKTVTSGTESNYIQILMTGFPNIYKYAIKITGSFGACLAGEINILNVDVSGYPSNSQILTVPYSASGKYYVSTGYFPADNSGTLGLVVTYDGSNLGNCGSIVIGSISVVGYTCDSSCASCTGGTCSCLPSQYLTNFNKCSNCPTGCSTCIQSGNSVTCSLCMVDPGTSIAYFLLGSTCMSDCGVGFYQGADMSTQPVCVQCASMCATCTSSSTCLTCKTGRLYYGGTNCGTSCPFGQYASSSSACGLCDSNCESCSTSSTHCLSCGIIGSIQSYLYSDNTCQTTCSSGTYGTTTNGAYVCASCGNGCSDCTYSNGNILCSLCGGSTYLSGSSCVGTCPSGTYGGADGNGDPACVACTSPCGKCSGGAATDCLSCATGHLIHGTTTCGSCPSGQYAITSSTCAVCISPCTTCTSATSCLTCGLISSAQSYVYTDNKCYATCPSGYYGTTDNNGDYVCTACPVGCAQCSLVSSAVQCSLCTSVYGTQYYLQSNSCTSNCGNGYYGGSDSNYHPVCLSCLSPCGNCVSSTSCLTCSTGVLVYGTTICTTQCPFGQYISGATCAPCNSNCASCVSSSATCTSCGLQSSSQSYLYTDSQCYTTCPTGSYAMTTNGAYLCAACPTGCVSCSQSAGSVQCTQCHQVSSTNFYLSATSCVVTCPGGTYGGVDGNSKPACVTCTAPCGTCSGSGATDCLTCATGHLIHGTTTCGSCPSDQFADTSSTCALCSSNCATCSSTSTNCLTCGLLSTVQSYLYTDSKCYSTCPSGSYANTDSNGKYVCSACPVGCAQCSLVSSAVQCTLCKLVSSIQYYFLNNACTSNCGNGYYGGSDQSTGNPTCLSCTSPCGNCLSSTSCLSCTTGLLVYGGSTCPSNCPSGQYADSSSTCALCNSNCATCTTSSTNCLSCGILSGAQSYLHSDKKCYINCPTTFFKSNVDNTCVGCDTSCNGCTESSTNCIACKSSFFRVIGATSCTSDCGSGYYGDTNTLTCTACPIGCAACSMSGSVLTCSSCNSFAGVQYYLNSSQCLSLCAPGKYQGLDSVTQAYTCISCTAPCNTCAGSGTYCTSCSSDHLIVGQNTCGSCPSGQYADSSSTCALCSQNCLTCSTVSSNCTSCGFSTLGYQLFLHSDYICYQTCPSGYYGDTSELKCKACDTSCTGCVNSNTNCILCYTDYYRKIGSNGCTQNCGTGYYGESNTGLCTVCPTGCAVCSESSSVVTCSSCQSIAGIQYYLSSNSCVQVCALGKYGGPDSNSLQSCNGCDSSCATCNGSSSANCLTCNGTKYFSYGENKCVSTCNDGQYASSGNICVLCNVNCITCVTSATNCLTCGNSSSGFVLYLYGTACVANCPIGYYPDSATNKCLQCDSTCYTCNGAASTNCLSCTTGSLASNNTCSSSCPSGEYSRNNICYSCLSSCSTCQNISYCTGCQSVAGQMYYLDSNHICDVYCPSGTYADSTSSTCVSCTAPCKTCSGGANQCTSCDLASVTPYLNYGSSTCSASCPDGQYSASSSYFCSLCSSNCKTCSTTSTTCGSCGLSLSSGLQLYLSSNKCLANCPTGTYGDSSNVCSNCDASCSGCTSSSTNCISCDSAYFRKAGSTLCVNPCPTGYYGDTNTNLCTACPYGCKVCSLSSGTISCTSCQQSSGVFYYLDSTANTCVPQCPSTYFGASGTLICTACSGNCATCIDSSNCLTCIAGKYLGYGETTCYSGCPDGQYYPSGSLKCQLCNTFCLTCSGTSTTCNSCTSIGGTAYYLSSNMCTSSCPFGYYGKLSDYTCHTCATGCQSCFNSTTDDCYSCGAYSVSVDYHLVYGTNTCQQTCPNGQYISGFKCLLCSSNCLTCTTSSTNCLTCGFSIAGANVYLYQGKCLLTCPINYYGDSTQNTCESCASGCLACTGPNLSDCSLCANVTTTTYYKDIKSNTCATTCPDGQFILSTAPNFCQLCSSTCVTCQGNAENCTSTNCSMNYFYLNNECLVACPNNYYADRSLRQCIACSTGCTTCFGTGATSCTVCSSTYFLQIGLTTCAQTCNAGEFANSLNNQCAICNSVCATCTSLNVCQSCQSVNGIAYFLNGTTCTATCPSNQFGQLSNYHCVACTDGCATCFGAGLSSCYSCGVSSGSVNYYLIYGTDICSQTCPDGQYANSTSFLCLLCSGSCKTCSATPTYCLTCGLSPYGYAVYLYSNQCLMNCPNSFWGNPSTNNCDACTPGCVTCFGSGLSACTVCGSDASSNVYYKHIGNTVCGTTCPNGQFTSASIPNLCQPCSSVCVTCQGTAENCTSSTCAENYYFLTNECLVSCPNNYYADRSLRQCIGCTTGCTTCFGTGTTSCTVCSSTYFLQIGLTTCAQTCNAGQFPNSLNNQCAICNSVCATCTSLTVCQSCQSVNGIAYFLNGTTCTATCPSNQFGQLSNYHCVTCTDGCATCFGAGLSSCNTCGVSTGSVNYYLIYGTNICSQTCPDGQYANSTSFKCLLCSSNCLTCDTNSHNCLSCGYSTQGYNLYLLSNVCLSSCTTGLYRESSTNTCNSCMSACSSCNAYTLSACSTCQDVNNAGTITKYYKYIGDTICGTTCPLGQFIDDANSPNQCVMCDQNCVGCYMSSTNCTIDSGCKVNYYYNNATNSCVLICPDGTFPNVVTKFCEFCTPGCALCTGSGLSKCTKCLQYSGTNYYLMINLQQCSTTCNSGEYGDPTYFLCVKCNSACATCTSASVCTTCQSVNGVAYYLNNTICTVTCPSTQYGSMSNFQCQNCANECATCFGGTNTQCTTCKNYNSANYYLQFGTNYCSSTCPAGYYANATDLTCKLCSSTCLTCISSSTNCLTCGFSPYGYAVYFYSNQCLMTCPNSFWGNPSTNNCDACATGCLTCFGSGLTSCTVCGNDTSSNIYYKEIGKTVCGTTCPNGQFISSTIANLCQPCSSVCVTCQGNAENCTSTNCSMNYFYLNNECLVACPNNYYADRSLRQCIACSTGCTTCFGTGATSCTVCSSTYFLQIGLTTCAQTCNAGEFANSLNNQCAICNSVCATCTSLTACQSCQSVNGIAYFLNGTTCTATCPSNQFGQLSNYHCVTCTDGCATCFGAGLSSCYSCGVSSGSVNYYLIYGTDICSQTCPDGQYANSTSFLCLLCSGSCKTCSATPTYCLTCGLSPYGYAVYLYSNQCLMNCPNSFWGNPSTNNCDACTPGCVTCFGSGLSSCSVCGSDASSNVYYKHIGNTVCGTTCPNGQFISASIPNLCQPCSSVCVTCQGTAENCTSSTCAENYYFLTNECLVACPNNYYADRSLRQCIGCSTGCTTCFGTGATSCTVCSSTYFLQIGLTTCAQTCNAGEFANSLNNQCAICNSVCATCTSLTVCQSCQSVNGIAYFLNGTICTATCPTNQFGQLSNYHCVTCTDGCATCFGAGLSSCNTCGISTGSVNYYLIYGTNICSQTCPDGQYANSTNFKCMLCDSNCLTCVSTPTNCLTCGFSSIGSNLYLYVSKCLLTCPNGYYADSSLFICTLCHFGCATCTGPLISNCTVCNNYNNSGTMVTYYKIVDITTCDTSCPTGQFISLSLANTCAYCDPGCISCSITSTNCTISGCSLGYYYYLTNSSCITTCPNNFYANSSTNLCTQCIQGCQLCYGGSLKACTKCQISASNVSYYKVIDIDTCSTFCPPGQYPYQTLLACQYCSAPCITCNTSGTDCQTCRNVTGVPYFNLNNQCLLNCPNGYYGQVSNNTCVLCPSGCSLCIGGTQNQCTKCTNASSITYFLIYSTTICSTSCPDGQYSNSAANKCFLCDVNCHTCVGTSRNCTSCSLTAGGILLFLENSICVQTCSISTFKYVFNNTCLPCDLGCLACTGPSLLECQSCNNKTDPTNSSNLLIYYLTIGNSICNLTCPTGQYIRAGYPNYCLSCSIQCIGCSVTSTNCTENFLCTVGYYFYRATNSCLTSCPNGYYANFTTKYCQPCAGGCTLCTAGDLNSCTQCHADPATSINYYKEIYMASCVTDCIGGEYSVASDFSCQPCHPSCALCNQTSTKCQKCKNVTGVLYFYFAQECVVTCPNGMYGESTNNTCVTCNSACLLCFGPAKTQCNACQPDNITNIYYYLSYGTTYCVTTCPYGQYAVNGSFTCQPCNINCATCVGTSTNCLTCTYVNTINIVYLLNAKCILTCPNPYWMNSTVQLDHQCSPCHSYCSVCTGPTNEECSYCSNQTVSGSLVHYYKDLYSTTCNPTCPNGQFISIVAPNNCVPCDSRCLRCAVNSTNCFQCAFNFYLFVPTNSCMAQCPNNYYNDPVITFNYYYCTQCTSGCLTCTGPGLNSCQTCQNATINGSIVSYFKNPTESICQTACITGYYGNVLDNRCDLCQTGCLTCVVNASNCFSCHSDGGNDYFKANASNRCVTICPSGYYGNSSDYTCHDCIYYTLNGSCILTCPSGTFAQSVGNKSICQDCNATNVTGNPCNRSYSFQVQTTVGSNGNSLVHKVLLNGGLSSNITAAQLNQTLQISVVQPSRRRLMVSGRLLTVSTPLVVQGISISSDRSVIFITTNYESFDFSTANVVIDFPAGSLVGSDGLLYQSTTGSFSMSSPIFMQSYYSVFSKNITYGAQGMIFVILSLLLLTMQLIIANRKGYHEALSFIMTLQVLGITRARQYPMNFDIFSVLLGYSYYELSFIPNAFASLFPVNYVENALQPLTFTFGDQNLIQNLGSIIEAFLVFEISLAIYYVIKHDRPEHFARMKLLHETLICLFMVINLYFSIIGMMSLSSNSLVGMTSTYLGSVVLSLLILICYSIYFLVWVRPFRLFELYKINNFFRVVGLAILASNIYGGIIMIDLSELLFILIDLTLYRHEKLSLKAYVAERMLIFIAFNASIFSTSYTTLLGLMGTTMALLFGIKLYYTAITTKEYIDQHKLQEASEIDVSDVVNLSVKDKAEDSKYAKLQGKESIDQKFNNSDHFIFNQSIDISRLEESPTKHQLLRMEQDSDEREEEEKKDPINEQSSSEQSNGELIVYLDPDDYKQEYLRQREEKQKRKQQPQPIKEEPVRRPATQMRSSRRNLRVDGMRTGANFYPRARGPQNHEIIEQDVEVIKVQPNNSQVDQSDIISDTTEGFGWLNQDDERNLSRARQNKTVWKIMDEQEVPKSKDTSKNK